MISIAVDLFIPPLLALLIVGILAWIVVALVVGSWEMLKLLFGKE